MKQVIESQWPTQERFVAQAALRVAQERKLGGPLVKTVRDTASQINSIDEVWHLHDFLSARRIDLDGKYDGQEDEILFVLAQVKREGWLLTGDLSGLESAKISKITALTRGL